VNQQLEMPLPPGAPFEQHFSVKEVAQMWKLGVDLVRKLFEHEEGVLRICHPESLHKRRYTTLRIPESVLRRVHRKLTPAKGAKPNSVQVFVSAAASVVCCFLLQWP
jgi:hypothetical protein